MDFTKILATFVTKYVTIMNTRLKQFLAAENISQSQFADTIKVVRASVSHVLSGRNNPGYDFIKAIMAAYPTLNMDWLILGKGKMYKELPQDGPTAIPEHDFSMISREPELFEERSYTEETIQDSPVIEQISVPRIQNSVPFEQSITLSKPAQSSINQRKVVKVTIFFDDGTYQEM